MPFFALLDNSKGHWSQPNFDSNNDIIGFTMDMSPVQSLSLTKGSPIIKSAPPPWSFFLGPYFCILKSGDWSGWMDGMVIIGQWSSKSTFGTSDWQAYRFVRKRLPQLLPLREGDSWWWWPGRWRRRVCLLQRWVMYARTSRPYVRHHVSLPPRWHSLIIIIDTNTQPSSQSQSFSNFYFLLLSTFKEVRINHYKQTDRPFREESDHFSVTHRQTLR